MNSVRGRVMAGAVLWTIGLFAVITIVLPLSRYAYHTVLKIHEHGVAAAVIALVCMIAGFTLARRAFTPFDDLRRRLSAVRQGTERQLRGRYPSEVQPLVDDLNALLAHSQDAVTRATAKAGDLAHGLKTPLAILSNEADGLAANGHPALAATIAQQIALMKRQVDYHLAHARAAASGALPGARCAVAESAEGLARTLQRLHAARGVRIDLDVPPAHTARATRGDLDEMLGNLLDNACKWANTRVLVGSASRESDLVITVEDDGPGIPDALRNAVLQRGVRADEAAPGSGLGLSIVRDLAELHGGSIVIDRSPLGGARAKLQLPAAAG